MADPEDASLIFGIGCLYFGVPIKEINSWAERVSATLDALSGVSDVLVTADVGEFGWKSIKDNAFPLDGSVTFKLRIPLEVQEQVTRGVIAISPELDPHENFQVFMFYDYYGPVSFIVVEDPSAEISFSSTSVIIVREYIEKQLKTMSTPARIGFVAPTSFHGDFMLKITEQDELLRLERTPTRAYAEFEFCCSADGFTTPAGALEFFFEEVKDELTFYYYLRTNRDTQFYATMEISALTSALIDIYERKGIRAWLRRMFTSSSKTRYLALKALVAEYNAQVNAAVAARNKDELYSADVIPYFSDEIDNVLSEDFSGFISGARDISSLLSEVRARQVEVTSLFLSAVAGGAAGALISLLVH